MNECGIMRDMRRFKILGILLYILLVFSTKALFAGANDVYFAEKLLNSGLELANATHYLEAIDLLDEARDIIELNEPVDQSLYSDVLYSLAQTKIKARLHQNFAAQYVKSALVDVQNSNKIKELISRILPQKLAEGYYLEGYILKRYFMRSEDALQCFTKAVNIDPGFVAAKRELSELISDDDQKN